MLGAGSFSVEVAGWAEESGWTVAGLVELLDPRRVGGEQEGHPIVAAAALPAGTRAIAAGGRDVDRRDAWAVAERHGFAPGTVVHPTAHVSRSARIEPGAVVAPLAVISAGTSIGEHCLLSRGTLVGHHTTLGRFVRLLPGANVAGHVRLGEGVTVGMSGAIVNDVSVGQRGDRSRRRGAARRSRSHARAGHPRTCVPDLSGLRLHSRIRAARRADRARLAEQHLIRAGRLLRRGDPRSALADLRRARSLRPPLSPVRALLALTGVRELLLRCGSSRPRLVALAFELWPRLRPPVLSRRRQE